MRRGKSFPSAFLLLLLLSFLREGTSQTSANPGSATEDYVTEIYTVTEDYTTEDPRTTTEAYSTEIGTITIDYTTEAPGTTTEDPGTTTSAYITEIVTIIVDYTTEDYTETTTSTGTSATTAASSAVLQPWAIVLITLAAVAVLIGLCVGLGFFLKKILHLGSPCSTATCHPHDPNFSLNHGQSGLHHRWGWKKSTASSAMEMDGRYNMPQAC